MEFKESARVLESSGYIESRQCPCPGDDAYLHLSDLRLAMELFRTSSQISVLDFGCGGSPYSSLFPNAQYRRADIEGVTGLDFIIPRGVSPTRLDCPSEEFDLIISSQVLEHVADYSGYLLESHRLLRQGGQLLISTHGTFEDHGCPADYWRWTATGLEEILSEAGFKPKRLYKLTTNLRAALFLMQRCRSPVSRRYALGWWMRWWYSMQNCRRASFERCCDSIFSSNRVVDASLPFHGLYIGLLAIAVKN